MLHNCKQRGRMWLFVTRAHWCRISHKAKHVSSWCVCVCVGEGVSWENKCDESMWIIVCAAEGTYGCNHRGLVRHILQSKVMCVSRILKSILYTFLFLFHVLRSLLISWKEAEMNSELTFGECNYYQVLHHITSGTIKKNFKCYCILWFSIWLILPHTNSPISVVLPYCSWLWQEFSQKKAIFWLASADITALSFCSYMFQDSSLISCLRRFNTVNNLLAKDCDTVYFITPPLPPPK